MSQSDQPADPQEVFLTFVGRLDARPDRAQVIDRLERGHISDDNGWCAHPLHTLARQPELHPCSTIQLLTAIQQAAAGRPITP